MPKIQWSGLPEALRKHLLLRQKEREVTEQDLLKLMEWRQSEPDAPDGLWSSVDTSKPASRGRFKTGHHGVATRDGWRFTS